MSSNLKKSIIIIWKHLTTVFLSSIRIIQVVTYIELKMSLILLSREYQKHPLKTKISFKNKL